LDRQKVLSGHRILAGYSDVVCKDHRDLMQNLELPSIFIDFLVEAPSCIRKDWEMFG
jgi:hypothetical protein